MSTSGYASGTTDGKDRQVHARKEPSEPVVVEATDEVDVIGERRAGKNVGG